MAARDKPLLEITPEVLLKAYSVGIFPMAESADDPHLYWIEPQARGLLPLDDVHVPRRLQRTIRQAPYDVRVDTDFHAVIDGCAAERPGRNTTWINKRIRALYGELFALGRCHTVEVWHEGRMVGGLYGVALGSAFFGESMFSTMRDVSKIALVYLAARLIHGGFTLLDTQFVTDHLKQFGTIEVDKAAFHAELEKATRRTADFRRLEANTPPDEILRIIAQARPGGHG